MTRQLTFCILTRVLAAFGLLLLLVSVTPLVSWWGTLLAGPWRDPTGEVLIVPGGSSVDGTYLGESSYWRAVYSVLVWRQGGFHRIVLCGGGSPLSTAELMRGFLEAHGVPHDAILVETHSSNTRENALFARQLLPVPHGRLVLLTSDYHMYRAVRAFRKAGLDVAPRPIPDARKRGGSMMGRWPVFLELVAESGKILVYKVRGWL